MINYNMFFNGEKTSVFRTNLDAHTTLSDGFFTPERVVSCYVDILYSGVAITDHDRAYNDVKGVDNLNITVLHGAELSAPGPRGITWHLLALGLPDDFPCRYASGQEAVLAVKEAGGLVYCAHPYLTGATSMEVKALGPIDGVEIFNTNAQQHFGKGLATETWDDLLDSGVRCTGLAVDDFHAPCDFRQAWTMICARERSETGLLNALRAGSFYSTQGPEFKRIECKDGHFVAEFTPCAEALIIGPCPHGEQRFNAVIGRVENWPVPGSDVYDYVTRMEGDVSNWLKGSYVRCQIRDFEGRYAWSQPYYID